MSYAATTSVPVDRSIGEIGALVKKRGGQRFAYFEEPERISIAFEMADRQVRFTVPLYEWRDRQFERDGRNSIRSQAQRQSSADQLNRSRARALLLVIKAKLESVEAKVETFEQAFLANVVLPSGQLLGDAVKPKIQAAYVEGPKFNASTLLPDYSGGEE